jgi:hypothetical protein
LFFGPRSAERYDFFVNLSELRRQAPRIPTEGICGVVGNDGLRHGTMVDLSATGLRVERKFDGRTATTVVQLEIELPGVDEILWAHGVVTFAQLSSMPGYTDEGQPNFWFRTGIRFVSMCQRERRMLRDYVVSTLRETRRRVDRRLNPDRYRVTSPIQALRHVMQV